ncbi:hypothetical protein D3C77_549720 [compost metagenome]
MRDPADGHAFIVLSAVGPEIQRVIAPNNKGGKRNKIEPWFHFGVAEQSNDLFTPDQHDTQQDEADQQAQPGGHSNEIDRLAVMLWNDDCKFVFTRNKYHQDRADRRIQGKNAEVFRREKSCQDR